MARIMKLERLGVAVLLFVGFACMELTGGKAVGLFVQTVNDKSLVQGGSSPALLVWAAIAIPLLAVVIFREMAYEVVGVPSWTRRFVAFVIDFFIAMATTAPFFALVPLVVEAFRTGMFAWSFERTYTVTSDWYLAIPLSLVLMSLLVLYFAVPVTKGRQTVGCYLLRLKVVPGESELGGRFGLSQALRRVVLAFIGLCSWPLIWLLGRGKDGTTWYDRLTNCRVTLVRYKS
jgi:hypothetical protein